MVTRANYRVDFRKIQRVLGYEPEWDVESGIDQIANVITSGGISDYRAIEYSNQGFLESTEEKSSDLLRVHGRWIADVSRRRQVASKARRWHARLSFKAS